MHVSASISHEIMNIYMSLIHLQQKILSFFESCPPRLPKKIFSCVSRTKKLKQKKPTIHQLTDDRYRFIFVKYLLCSIREGIHVVSLQVAVCRRDPVTALHPQDVVEGNVPGIFIIEV